MHSEHSKDAMLIISIVDSGPTSRHWFKEEKVNQKKNMTKKSSGPNLCKITFWILLLESSADYKPNTKPMTAKKTNVNFTAVREFYKPE